MKNTVQQICAVLLFATLLTSNAFALTVIPVDTDKVESQQPVPDAASKQPALEAAASA